MWLASAVDRRSAAASARQLAEQRTMYILYSVFCYCGSGHEAAEEEEGECPLTTCQRTQAAQPPACRPGPLLLPLLLATAKEPASPPINLHPLTNERTSDDRTLLLCVVVEKSVVGFARHACIAAT